MPIRTVSNAGVIGKKQENRVVRPSRIGRKATPAICGSIKRMGHVNQAVLKVSNGRVIWSHVLNDRHLPQFAFVMPRQFKSPLLFGQNLDKANRLRPGWEDEVIVDLAWFSERITTFDETAKNAAVFIVGEIVVHGRSCNGRFLRHRP